MWHRGGATRRPASHYMTTTSRCGESHHCAAGHRDWGEHGGWGLVGGGGGGVWSQGGL